MFISISWNPNTEMLHMYGPDGKRLVKNTCKEIGTVLEVITAITGQVPQWKRSICPACELYHLPVEATNT